MRPYLAGPVDRVRLARRDLTMFQDGNSRLSLDRHESHKELRKGWLAEQATAKLACAAALDVEEAAVVHNIPNISFKLRKAQSLNIFSQHHVCIRRNNEKGSFTSSTAEQVRMPK